MILSMGFSVPSGGAKVSLNEVPGRAMVPLLAVDSEVKSPSIVCRGNSAHYRPVNEKR